MEARSMALWKLYRQQPSLWEGWDHADTPVGFHDSERAVLFGHPNPSSEFIIKEVEGIIYHVANPKPANFTANSSIELNGVPTATVIWHEQEQQSMLGLITHEAFHAHQMATGCPMGQIAMAMQYPVNDWMVQTLAEIEGQLLYQAVSSNRSDDLVTAALDARAARQALLSMELKIFEDEVELGEGLATYVEIQTSGPNTLLWDSKIQTLQKLNKNAWGADRLRFYYSGMAWALLCDRYAPGWQGKGWNTLAGLTAGGIGHTPNPQNREFPGVDFPEILAKQQQEAEERGQKMDQTLARALPGTGLRVEITTKGNPIGGGWNPNTAVTFPGVGRYHPTGLMYAYDSGTNLKVEADCIETDPCRHMIFERNDLTIHLNGSPLTQGMHKGTLEISGGDSKVFIPKAIIEFCASTLTAEEVID